MKIRCLLLGHKYWTVWDELEGYVGYTEIPFCDRCGKFK